MKHDRMQRDVRFTMCAEGFLLQVGGFDGSLGTMYAYSSIEEVCEWFLNQYATEIARPICPEALERKAS